MGVVACTPLAFFTMTHTQLPHHFYVKVNNKHLGPNMPDGFTEGIWHGIHSREGQMLMCHVMLETGAHWSGIPLHALSTTNYFFAPDLVMPWYAMGEQIIAVQLPYLEGLKATDRNHNVGRHTGIMIDWADGYSRYPQEHKPLNLISLDSGPFVLMPNNYVIYKDKHFTNGKRKDDLSKYKRNEKIYWE
jgi:hypothetical protein